MGVVLPIGLLAVAVLTDWSLHHAFICRPPARLPPAPASIGTSAFVPPAPPPVTVVRERINDSCAAPDVIDDCEPSALTAVFARDLPPPGAGRAELEQLWLSDLAAGNHAAAYGLAWLGSRRALPLLRERLLADRYFYGWETSSPDDPEILFASDQFPHHQALIQAIERIDGRPLRDAVALTAHERRRLATEAADACSSPAASWLLHELAGAPLPRASANRARRRTCELRTARAARWVDVELAP